MKRTITLIALVCSLIGCADKTKQHFDAVRGDTENIQAEIATAQVAADKLRNGPTTLPSELIPFADEIVAALQRASDYVVSLQKDTALAEKGYDKQVKRAEKEADGILNSRGERLVWTIGIILTLLGGAYVYLRFFLRGILPGGLGFLSFIPGLNKGKTRR